MKKEHEELFKNKSFVRADKRQWITKQMMNANRIRPLADMNSRLIWLKWFILLFFFYSQLFFKCSGHSSVQVFSLSP